MTAGDDHIGKGQICSHTPIMFSSKILTGFEIFQCLYVDDEAFPFTTHESLVKEMNLVFHHFARFGLEMHIGQNGSESKTECVFFPPPSSVINGSYPPPPMTRGKQGAWHCNDPLRCH